MKHQTEISSKFDDQTYTYNEELSLEKEQYLFSSFILAAILIFSYPYWTYIEDGVGIKNKPDTFLYNNFIYIFTVILTTVLYFLFRNIININDIELLNKWELKNPDYQRIYWMDPLEYHQNLSLSGKLFYIIINSILFSSIIIYISVLINLTLVFLVFDSNLEIIFILFAAFALFAQLGQIYFVYEKGTSARGWYLYDGCLISRTAFIFRSFHDGKLKSKKLTEMNIKEKKSFQYDVTMFQLRTSKSNWRGTIIASSDDYNKIDELKNTIQEYFTGYLK